MEIFDAGHVEIEKDLPGPLRPGWYPGTWALPATTISGASLFVLVAVFGCLQISAVSRALFQLPVPSAWAALAAAALAWLITWVCRTRPGGVFARIWALALAMFSSGLSLAALASGDLGRHPQIHGLALASFVASLTLLPRLLRLHPAHWLVQHVALLALVVALFIALPASLFFSRQAVKEREQRLAETIAELDREAEEVRAVMSTEWTSLPGQRQEVLKQMQRLQDLPLDDWVPDRHLWQGATLLAKDEELAAAYREILESLVSGIDPSRTPKLWQTQFVWNREARQWEKDPLFPEQSAAVASYHRRLGEMLRLLVPPSGEGAALRSLGAFYEEKRREADERLAALSETWAEDWVPPLYAAAPAVDPPASPLAGLLQRPLERDRGLTPASLERLLGLDLWRATQMAPSTPGCGRRDYMEDGFKYFRVDCFAYVTRMDPGPGADLRVELRIVYKAEMELGGLSMRDVPAEIYFLFPVPASLSAASYREDVMEALETAVKSQHPAAAIERKDRNGSPSKGFSFETQAGRFLHVEPYTIDDLSGGIPGIQVRGFYSGMGI